MTKDSQYNTNMKGYIQLRIEIFATTQYLSPSVLTKSKLRCIFYK